MALANETGVPIEIIIKDWHKCAICGIRFHGMGHNPTPVTLGRCCDECNLNVVLPYRIQQLYFTRGD
ncbi:MAG: hypothetical protein CME55_00325 [Halieaceae bacterium]|nr:hypothetical protein [Halieaceae bacterium]